VSYVEAREWMERASRSGEGGDRLYNLLAYFDTRDGTPMAGLVRAAREGWERAGPDMPEASAWDEFDALWSRREQPVVVDTRALEAENERLRDALAQTIDLCNAMREFAPTLNMDAERALRDALKVATWTA
jgi:hypothetical protein